MSWVKWNPNPQGKQVGDCSVRAVARALNTTWEDAYSGIAVQGFMMNDMPSNNGVWGAYLRNHGFVRKIIPNECPDCYTVNDFCAEHPHGVYVLAVHNHVVTIVDGDHFDTWPSGNEIVLYYFERMAE